MFARYAKEDFDGGDWERKRAVIKRLGADLRLDGRTIQFTPVKYLVSIAETYPELKQQFEPARTDSEQMKKDLKEGLISQWYTRHDDAFATQKLSFLLVRNIINEFMIFTHFVVRANVSFVLCLDILE